MELQGELDSGEELPVVKNIIKPNVIFEQASGAGRAEEIRTRESLGIRVGSSPSTAFTIRGYVAGARKVDFSQCWPFSPQLLLEKRLQEGSKYLLPPLEIHMHRYWGCPDCVGKVIPSDGLACLRDVDQEFDASNADTFATNGPQGLLDGLLGKEGYFCNHIESTDLDDKSHDIFKEDGPEQDNVAQNELMDVRSDEGHSYSYERVSNVKNGTAKDKALEHLTTDKLSLNLKEGAVNQSHSENVAAVCNLISQPIELNIPASHSIFVDDKNRVFADAIVDQMAVEAYRPGSIVAENAKALQHTSVAGDSAEKSIRVRWPCDESQDDKPRESEMDPVADATPVSTTFTSTIEDNVAKDACAIQAVSMVETDHIMPNRMKAKARQHNEKGKARKKRLIADLIATLPSDQIRWNAGNHDCAQTSKLKAIFHKSKIVKNQGGSKDATHNLKKFKGKRKYISDVHSASLQTNIPPEKSQRLGDAAQSSPSTRAVEDLRMTNERDMANERHIVQNSSERPQADHSSRYSREKVLIQDETKTPTQLECDDVLLDLVGFIAQNRSERHAALPNSGRCFDELEKSTGESPAHVVDEKVEQLRDQLQLQSNSSSRHLSVRGQSASKCMPHDGSVKRDVSGQVQKASTFSEIQDTICQGSRDCSVMITKTGENDLDHSGKLISSVALTGQKKKGTKREKSAVHKSVGGSNSSSREDVTGEEDNFRCTAFDIVPKDGQAYPVARGRLQHINPVHNTPEEFDVSGKPEQKGTISEFGFGVASRSKVCSDIIIRSDERNLGHGCKRISESAMKGPKDRQSQRKRSAAHKSRKKSISSSKQGKEYDPACLVAEGAHLQSIQGKESLMPHKLDTLALTKEERAIFEMQGRITLDSRGRLDTITSANLKRIARRGELVNTVAMTGKKDKQSIASKSDKSADLKPTEKSDLFSRKGLVHISAEAVLSDDQMDLVAGRGNQQLNQVCQSLMPVKLDVLGKSAEAGTSPETWDRVVSCSRDCSDNMTPIGEENFGFRGNLVNFAAGKGQENKSPPACERKRTDAYNSSKESSSYSKQAFVAEQDPLRCIPSEVDLENGHVVLIPIRNQQIDEMRHTLIPDNLHASEEAIEAGANSVTANEIVSGSGHSSDILTRTGNESTVNRGNLARYVVKKGQMNSGPINSPSKNSAARKSVKERKAFAKSSSRVTIIEETNAALNAALANAKAGRSAFGDTVNQGHSNCWDQRLHSSIAKTMASETLQTTVRGGFSSAQKLLETVVAPTSKIRERLLVDNCCTCLTLNSQGLLADSSTTDNKTLESKSSCPKDNDLHQQMNCLKLTSSVIAPGTVYNSQIGMPSPTLRNEDAGQLIDRNCTFRSRTGDAGQTNMNQVDLNCGASWVQSPCHDDNASVLRALAMQSSRSATCLAEKSFIGANGSQYLPSSGGSYTSLGCVVPYVTFTDPSIKSIPDWIQHSNHSTPLISSPAFTIAQGNNIVIPTALSQETFSRNKYDLQSYIQERIEAYRPSWASGSGNPRRTAATMAEEGAKILAKVDKTSSRAMSSCNPYGNPKAEVGSLELFVPNQKSGETMKNNSEMATKQGIQRTMCPKSGQVPTVNQASQPEIITLAPAVRHTKTKDFASKQTIQSKTSEPTHVSDTKDLTMGLAPLPSEHKKFGKKPARMVLNDRNTVKITGMYDRGGSADYKHFLKLPVVCNTELQLPIHSTVPFAQTPIPEQYFYGVHETNTDKHGRFLSALDKSFTMQERQFFSCSPVAGNILFGIMPDKSTSANVGGIYSGKTIFSNPDMMGFVRPAVRDETFLFPGKFIGESSAKTGEKEDSDFKNHCRDTSLGLSLSSTHVTPEKKQGNETVGKLNTVADSPSREALAA